VEVAVLRVNDKWTGPDFTFATVWLRVMIIKGPGSRAAGVAMAVKLIESTQDHWRMVNAPRLAALARTGAAFIDGKPAGRPGGQAQPRSPRKIHSRVSATSADYRRPPE
jgi:hypothetical protein